MFSLIPKTKLKYKTYLEFMKSTVKTVIANMLEKPEETSIFVLMNISQTYNLTEKKSLQSHNIALEHPLLFQNKLQK